MRLKFFRTEKHSDPCPFLVRSLPHTPLAVVPGPFKAPASLGWVDTVDLHLTVRTGRYFETVAFVFPEQSEAAFVHNANQHTAFVQPALAEPGLTTLGPS